jgi:hypothetical protein
VFLGCRTNQNTARATREIATNPPTAPPMMGPRLFWPDEGEGEVDGAVEDDKEDVGVMEGLDVVVIGGGSWVSDVSPEMVVVKVEVRVVVSNCRLSCFTKVREAVNILVRLVDVHTKYELLIGEKR